MNQNHCNWMLKAGLAVLLPLVIEQSATEFKNHCSPQCLFYSVSAAGVALIIAGMKVASPVLASGMLYGGLLTILKNYYDNWHNLDDRTKLLTLLLALGLLLFLTLRGRNNTHSKGRARRPAARGANRRPGQ